MAILAMLFYLIILFDGEMLVSEDVLKREYRLLRLVLKHCFPIIFIKNN